MKGNEDEVIFILNSLETLSNALGNNFSLDASANVVLTTWDDKSNLDASHSPITSVGSR